MPLTPGQQKTLLSTKVNQTLKNIRVLDKSTVKDVLRELKKAKFEISEVIKGTGRFTPAYLTTLRNEINDKIVSFNKRMIEKVGDAQDISWKNGSTLTGGIVKTAGMGFKFPAISNALLIANKDLTADLITDMATGMKQDVSRVLRRSVLVGENQFQAARKIDKIIGVSKRSGYFNRSDVIARQEIGRMFSIARQAEDEIVNENVPLNKEWLNAQDARVRPAPTAHVSMLRWNHKVVHGQRRKIDEFFDVSGEKAMFPRDPNLSPENSVGCRCTHVSFPEEWEGIE